MLPPLIVGSQVKVWQFGLPSMLELPWVSSRQLVQIFKLPPNYVDERVASLCLQVGNESGCTLCVSSKRHQDQKASMLTWAMIS